MMCELFAMSANQPTDVEKYLSLLMPRGGKTGPHADGWGIAYYEGRASRVFKDAAPAAESRYLAMLARAGLKSTSVVAHIRKANPSVIGRATANTHPFEREWNGYSWVFAHNGKLPGIESLKPQRYSRFQPLGGTDSEQAFCRIMNVLSRNIMWGESTTSERIIEVVRPVVKQLSKLGEFNFILSNGEYTLVHAHTNLHALEHSAGTSHNAICVLATAPLTDEAWQALAPGSIHVYKAGRTVGMLDA